LQPNKTGSAPAFRRDHMRGALRGRMSNIAIPLWLDEVAPGAAERARFIAANENLSDTRLKRLERLAGETTELAWRELSIRRDKRKKQLSAPELVTAQSELMWEAYRAPDFRAIGQPEIERSKARLADLGTATMKLAGNLREIGHDGQLAGMWLAYRNNRSDDPLLQLLPDHLLALAAALDRVGDFCERAASLYKPEGPVPRVGQPEAHDADKTTVIRQIARVCRRHFGLPLYSTVATLANASLGRKDITDKIVRGSLRNPGETLA
jgi:hypothetical protein